MRRPGPAVSTSCAQIVSSVPRRDPAYATFAAAVANAVNRLRWTRTSVTSRKVTTVSRRPSAVRTARAGARAPAPAAIPGPSTGAAAWAGRPGGAAVGFDERRGRPSRSASGVPRRAHPAGLTWTHRPCSSSSATPSADAASAAARTSGPTAAAASAGRPGRRRHRHRVLLDAPTARRRPGGRASPACRRRGNSCADRATRNGVGAVARMRRVDRRHVRNAFPRLFPLVNTDVSGAPFAVPP